MWFLEERVVTMVIYHVKSVSLNVKTLSKDLYRARGAYLGMSTPKKIIHRRATIIVLVVK